MEDTRIKGTGNSRTLKGPPNLLTIYPTWEAAAQAIAEGTFPIDIGQLNPAGCETIGTALDKPNLLSDETAEIYGLQPDEFPNAVPDEILQIIASKLTGITGNLSQKLMMETGSYAGAGGASKEILFGINAEIVIFSYRSYTSTASVSIAVRDVQRPFVSNLNAAQRVEYSTWTDNSVVFSSSSSVSYLDETQYQYKYVAIGRADS